MEGRTDITQNHMTDDQKVKVTFNPTVRGIFEKFILAYIPIHIAVLTDCHCQMSENPSLNQ